MNNSIAQWEIALSLMWNDWAGPRDFMLAGIAQYNARIFEIKEMGWKLEQRNVSDAATGKRWVEHRMVADQNRIMVAEYYSSKQESLKV